MSAILQSLRAAYEINGMLPEEIAETQSLDVAAVKAGLMQVSAKYRKDCGLPELAERNRLDFNDDDLEASNEVIKEIMHGAEDEHLRFKAATYIRDDKKGRKELSRVIGSGGINILQFNQMVQNVREKVNGLVQKKEIEV